MDNKERISLICDNLDAFHTMCLSATLLCTYNDTVADKHTEQIIDFLGKAFALPIETIKTFEDVILDQMMNIGLITDYQALASFELLTDDDKDNIELYEIKGRIIEEVAIIEAQSYHYADVRLTTPARANMKYEYFHHPYNPKLRFWQLERLALSGNVAVVRLLGIMRAVGIGCNSDFNKAKNAFLKCILWGDKVATKLLDYLFKMNGILSDEYKQLDRAIFHGEIPKENTKAWQLYNLSRYIKAFIIAPKKDPLINDELANVLLNEELPYNIKTELIMVFNEKTWENANGYKGEKLQKIGFEVSEDE